MIEVYHRNDPDFHTHTEFTPRNYTFVASVFTTDNYTAYERTNHVSTDWTKQPKEMVVPSFYASHGARSTSVGDILVHRPSNRVYAIKPQGYEYLGELMVEEPTITGT